MAHYAFLDENNIVIQVIPGRDEGEDGVDWEQFYANELGKPCKRTSYRTFGNSHPTGEPFRGNYAGIGFKYDSENDVFIPPQPFPSWVLSTEHWLWMPPEAQPQDVPTVWDEATQTWKEVV